MPIDLSAIETELLQALGIVLTTVIIWGIRTIIAHLKIKNASQIQDALDDAAMKGISFAVMQTQQEIKAKGWDHPTVQNALIAQGATYVATKFPDMLANAGVDPTTVEGRKAISDLVTRALPAGTAAAAASPTTPETEADQTAVIATPATNA